MNRSAQPDSTALVLGGGGSTGHAWAIGVVAGLHDAGVDLTQAALTVGTSSGATAAAQITRGTPPTDLFAAILAEIPPPPRPAAAGAGRDGARTAQAATVIEVTGAIIEAAADAADMRRRMGAAAMEASAGSDGGRQQWWRTTVAARLPADAWPQQRLLITAVDARTGEPVVFDRDSGVDLVDAVAASTSNGFAYSIGEGRYIDGGYRRNENADLALGHERVLVLSPFAGRSRQPEGWGMDLATQVDELRAGGSRVETLFPAGGSEFMFGATAMDLSLRPRAAHAGYDQGRGLAERLWV